MRRCAHVPLGFLVWFANNNKKIYRPSGIWTYSISVLESWLGHQNGRITARLRPVGNTKGRLFAWRHFAGTMGQCTRDVSDSLWDLINIFIGPGQFRLTLVKPSISGGNRPSTSMKIFRSRQRKDYRSARRLWNASPIRIGNGNVC